jgi:DNA-binding NarL/FixJ family response regulator
LTRRETQVLELVARGCSNADIAGRLFVSEHTVKRHVANILGKLDVPSRAAAAARYASRPSAAPGV